MIGRVTVCWALEATSVEEAQRPVPRASVDYASGGKQQEVVKRGGDFGFWLVDGAQHRSTLRKRWQQHVGHLQVQQNLETSGYKPPNTYLQLQGSIPNVKHG